MNNFNQYGTLRFGNQPQQNATMGGITGMIPVQQFQQLNQNQAIGGLGDPNNNFQINTSNISPQQDDKGSWWSDSQNLSTLANIGGTLAGLYLGNKQLKMGERALNLQEQSFNNNLAHNIQSYNTKLADQAKARGFVQGQSEAEINDHIEKNSLKRI